MIIWCLDALCFDNSSIFFCFGKMRCEKISGGKEAKMLGKTTIGHANYSVWTKKALWISLHEMYLAQTIGISGGGSVCLIGHFVQYTIVKATHYPPPEMTILCAHDIPCKKKKVMEIAPEVVVEL